MKPFYQIFSTLLIVCSFLSCDTNDNSNSNLSDDATDDMPAEGWVRSAQNPVLRDVVPAENYQIASDPHIFQEDNGDLRMIYSGDENGNSSIKLATGSSVDDWTLTSALLSETGPSGLDIQKETGFYRKSSSGIHQIYYIGYDDEATYEAQIYLAEANSLEGPYTQMATPVISRGTIAGKEVYLMTSPSVVEHEGLLYMIFIGWDAAPNEVIEIWIIGATSDDEGQNWSNFQLIDTPIGAEGQVTKTPSGDFKAVRTGDYQGGQAIFYAIAPHPFGPWTTDETPILISEGASLEKDEIIGAQLTIDSNTGQEYLYYTGADYQIGWWIMLATKM